MSRKKSENEVSQPQTLTDVYVAEHERLLTGQLTPLRREILASVPVESDALTQKVALYLIAGTALGSPTNKAVIKETFGISLTVAWRC